ncbi:MAG: RDD family protein [Nitrincola lacisaponensis]|uniref:Putative transmembrane protein n=1 Tax=Nitrincola lacisaponensis TaxID=267850 RepID=A0A063Y724_9GAMM|nr:RDD family protein [Nitrincola lacisaponensis]KDE40551.1 putative transmembrane protein [Nitrincola lacisaponensis]
MKRPFRTDISDIRPASLVKRLLAMLYDFMLIVAIWMMTGFAAVGLNDGEAVEGPLFNASLFCITFLFFGFFWTRNGQTLGMQAWRIRVQTLDGYRLSWSRALLRFLLSILSWIPLGLGYLWILFNNERLAWHDTLSESCVVQLPKTKKKPTTD